MLSPATIALIASAIQQKYNNSHAIGLMYRFISFISIYPTFYAALRALALYYLRYLPQCAAVQYLIMAAVTAGVLYNQRVPAV
jgi:hypothetical protein